jgi:hypothetical protein
MRATWRAIGFAVVMCASTTWPCSAQGTTTAAARPAFTAAEMENFLLHADITATIKVSKGVTKARQVRMSDGRVTHDAQVQDVDISLPIFEVDPKHTEVNFKDSYRYNVAAYRLSLLLGLDNVPMSVDRVVDHKPSAVTWWLDDVMMEEGDRLKKKSYGPQPVRTLGQLSVLRVFDELIQNRDRNAGNLMWTNDWKMWMIDHTRAFRLGKDLLNPKVIERCERTMLEKMRGLNASQLAEVMGKSLTKDEITALLARRDAIVKLLDARIAQFGEDKILFGLQQPTS